MKPYPAPSKITCTCPPGRPLVEHRREGVAVIHSVIRCACASVVVQTQHLSQEEAERQVKAVLGSERGGR